MSNKKKKLFIDYWKWNLYLNYLRKSRRRVGIVHHEIGLADVKPLLITCGPDISVTVDRGASSRK